MRSLKNIIGLKPHKLYGRKFKVSRFLDDDIYTIEKLPEYVMNNHNNHDECWIGWVGGGVPYSWGDVVDNFNEGRWFLI